MRQVETAVKNETLTSRLPSKLMKLGKIAAGTLLELGGSALDLRYCVQTFEAAGVASRLEEGSFSDEVKLTFASVKADEIDDCLRIGFNEWHDGVCLSTEISVGCSEGYSYIYAEQTTGDGASRDGVKRIFTGDRSADSLSVGEVLDIVKTIERMQQHHNIN